MHKYWIIAVALVLSGCAAVLTDGGSKVRIITAVQRPSCTFVRLVTATANLGPDKPGSALKKALNEVAAIGGNGLYIVNSDNHWIDGASVAGEALRCG